jgi:hypothetical protein
LTALIGIEGENTDSFGDLATGDDEYLSVVHEDDHDKQMAEQRRLIAEWEVHSRDTAPEIDRRRLAAAWSTPAWRKLQMAAEMSQAAQDLTLAGLRRRHPDADEQEIRFRFASLLFGSQVAQCLCPKTEEHDTDDV